VSRLAEIVAADLPTGQPLTGVEVGVLRGASASTLLRLRPDIERLYLVDDWSLEGLTLHDGATGEDVRRQAHERFLLPAYRERVRWVEMHSFVAGLMLQFVGGLDLCFDFCVIDGCHDKLAVKSDYTVWRGAASRLYFHDYGHPDFPGVKEGLEGVAVTVLGDYVVRVE